MSAHKVLRGGSLRAAYRRRSAPDNRDVSLGFRLVATVPGGASRVLRGGSFVSNAYYLRAAYRRGGTPVDRDDYIGFRLAATRKET